MSEQSDLQALADRLEAIGIRLVEPGQTDQAAGFPLRVQLEHGQTVALVLNEPGLLSLLDADEIGAAMIDGSGHVSSAWGLARKLRWLRPNASVFTGDAATIFHRAFATGAVTEYLDGVRVYAASLGHDFAPQLFVLVADAEAERQARGQAMRHLREARALKSIGRTLNMNQSLIPLAYGAVHEMASVVDLAAALLWTLDASETSLELVASTGANRSGTAALAQLGVGGGAGCLAELVAAGRQSIYVPNVNDHPLTRELEAKFCYLKPGALCVYPLITGGKLIGVLELIGREGDTLFDEHRELFETMAEHLALALNGAMLFESVERLAGHDSLTGIANHRTLHEFLGQRLAEASRTGASLGVVMIDVDHFRAFNEEEGHETGDLVLRRVAQALRESIRPYDLAARYGGEEFCVILPSSTIDATLSTAERMRVAVESLNVRTRTGITRKVTISLGCAVFPMTQGDAGTLVRAADLALYQAKRAGRNCVRLFQNPTVESSESPTLVQDLVLEACTPTERRTAHALLGRLQTPMRLFRDRLHLSGAQADLLAALLALSTLETKAVNRIRRRAKVAEHWHRLRPSLLALESRYDGKDGGKLEGEAIPLLARLTAVLLELDAHKGKNLGEDPGRYDPQLVAIALDLDEAA